MYHRKYKLCTPLGEHVRQRLRQKRAKRKYNQLFSLEQHIKSMLHYYILTRYIIRIKGDSTDFLLSLTTAKTPEYVFVWRHVHGKVISDCGLFDGLKSRSWLLAVSHYCEFPRLRRDPNRILFEVPSYYVLLDGFTHRCSQRQKEPDKFDEILLARTQLEKEKC